MNLRPIHPAALSASARRFAPQVKAWVCPACGNTDRGLIQDNGRPRAHPDFTLLCVAQSGPCGDPSPDNPDDQTCGMQWEPNNSDN